MKIYFDTSSRTIRNIVVLLLFLWLTELHSILWAWKPKLLDSTLDLFLQKGYHRSDISLEWWIKTFFDDLLVIVALNVAAYYVMNKKIAIALQWIGFYYAADLILYFWNYKSAPWQFCSLLLFTTVIFILIIIKRKQKRGMIIDIEKAGENENDESDTK
jgi:hypothetical protein